MKTVIGDYVFEIQPLSIPQQILMFQLVAQLCVLKTDIPIEILDFKTLASLATKISELTVKTNMNLMR